MDNLQYIKYVRDFTQAYRCSSDKYTREVACLQIQMQYTVKPMRQGDYIAGRLEELQLGFLPQSASSLGYYFNEAFFQKLMEDEKIADEQKVELQEAIDFWKKENTQYKLYKAYPEEICEQLVHDKPFTTPAVAFALYRLGSIQMDMTKLLDLGIPGMIQLALDRKDANPFFYQGIADILELFRSVCLRYGREAENEAMSEGNPERKRVLLQVAENMQVIAYDKPRTFWQALQVSFLYVVLSGARNFGRMDITLGRYLKNDLENGVLTWEEALDILMNAWYLMDERGLTADTRVIVGGKDIEDCESAECFTMLALEATRRTRTLVPQLTLRCHTGMNPAVYEKALQVIGEGTTFPMLYNDDENIPMAAEAFGIDEDTAKNYVPYGCGEYVIYNQSLGTPSGTLNLLHGLNDFICGEKQGLLTSGNFEEFYQRYLTDMSEVIHWLALQEKMEYDIAGQEAPFLFFSAIMDDCMGRGLPLLEGGIRYLGGTLESYGNINTSDSLTAIAHLVYEQKSVKPEELTEALKKNFEGHETLQLMLKAQPKYGNDEDSADEMAVRLHNDICNMVRDEAAKVGLDSYMIVMINNSMNSIFGKGTGASADGRSAYTYMANGNNPMSGMDRKGITAMLNSLVKLKANRHAGAVQNMRFTKEMFGPRLEELKGLLRTYFANGGTQAMITVLNRGDLQAAMKDPDKYRNLIVRVGGFSARFVELDKEVQRELLARTLY